MSYGTARRLPTVKFRPGDSIYLERWWGHDPETGKDRTEEVAVEVIEVRHDPYWQLDCDGRHTAEPAIYQVRVIATGEIFPASERGLNRYPRPTKANGGRS